jgi:2C-methyl-D-erythritol 2,4-cyclodiphosphate synthase
MNCAGQLFPDNDAQWKGASSDIFVKEAVSGAVSLAFERVLLCLCRLRVSTPQTGGCVLPAHSTVTPCAALSERAQVKKMHEAGYVLGNLDATIIAQKPKLSPHKENIRANLCKLLDAHPSVINIKVRAFMCWFASALRAFHDGGWCCWRPLPRLDCQGVGLHAVTRGRVPLPVTLPIHGVSTIAPPTQAKTHEKVDSIGEERSIGCHAVIMLIRKDMA